MNDNKLIMMVGIPRSGKSTRAKEMGYPIVNPDAIRLAIHGNPFIPQAEPLVWCLAKYMVKSLFLAGHKTVILDATNTTRQRREEWKSRSWNRDYEIIESSKDECVERAKKTGMEYLIPIIESMSDKYEPVTGDEYE